MTSATGEVVDHINIRLVPLPPPLPSVGACTLSPADSGLTFNQGLMLGAATVLAHPSAGTLDTERYGRDAVRFARHLVEQQTRMNMAAGPVLYDRCEVDCGAPLVT